MEEIFKSNNDNYHGPIIKYLYMEIADPNILKSYKKVFNVIYIYQKKKKILICNLNNNNNNMVY